MRPAPGIGEHGDFVCYSPWKFFPIPNGAFLIRRPHCRLALEPLMAALADLGEQPSTGFSWLRSNFTLTCEEWLGRSPQSFSATNFFADPVVAPMPQRPRAAVYAGPALLAANVEEAARQRRDNDAMIRRHFLKSGDWRAFATPADSPWRTVLRAASCENAARTHDALRLAGVEAECWPPLPPEVSKSSGQAIRLRNTLLCLPCQQALTSDQIAAGLYRSGV